jgi:hypothetical protein
LEELLCCRISKPDEPICSDNDYAINYMLYEKPKMFFHNFPRDFPLG